MLPVYSEEQAIGDDLDLIIETMDASDYDYEIIVIDDGSTHGVALKEAQSGSGHGSAIGAASLPRGRRVPPPNR